MKRLRELIRDCARTALAVLHEIFDEAAYARFLSRAGIVSSSEAYAAFRREFEEGKMRRPKCC
jgi:ABC-type enterochelin transport system ATPase subunit